MDTVLNLFKGKKVLITGHTGFKGAWLAIWLKELGAHVIGYALDPSTEQDCFVLSNIKHDMVDIRGDIRDSDKLDDLFKRHKPEIVFHLAAQPLVKYSYQQPKYTYEVNVIGTLNVLESVRTTDETKVGIMITSDKCYEDKESIWGYRECDPVGGYDPYSSSKGCCELLVSSYRNSFFHINRYDEHQKAIASARAGNVIGGGDWSGDRLLPDCIRALKSNKEIVIRNPEYIRPWQHVLEPLSGYLHLASKMFENGPRYSGAWNFGPELNCAASVEEIVNRVIKLWGNGNWVASGNVPASLHETKLLSLDICKAKHELHWQPKWDIDTALEKTIEWYKNDKSTIVRDLCVQQIREYCNS